MHYEFIIGLFTSVGLIIWRMSAYASRLKAVEDSYKEHVAEDEKKHSSLSTWKHEVVNPTLMELKWELQLEDTRPHELPSVRKR